MVEPSPQEYLNEYFERSAAMWKQLLGDIFPILNVCYVTQLQFI